MVLIAGQADDEWVFICKFSLTVDAVGELKENYLLEKDYRILDNPYQASMTSSVLYPALNHQLISHDVLTLPNLTRRPPSPPPTSTDSTHRPKTPD